MPKLQNSKITPGRYREPATGRELTVDRIDRSPIGGPAQNQFVYYRYDNDPENNQALLLEDFAEVGRFMKIANGP